MENWVTVSTRHLRAEGKRITPQRKMILDILAQANGHLDAHDIYERGRRQDSRLSLSTVYRTLGILKETDLVHELHLDEEHHHYELAGKKKHSHMICLKCGKVIEVDSEAFVEAVKAVGKIQDFTISSIRLELTGYCSSCRNHAPD